MPLLTAHVLPPVEYLDACFRLDAETGTIFWKERPSDHFPCHCYKRRFAFRIGNRADVVATGGYRRVRLTVDGKARWYGAHRIIWKLFYRSEPAQEIDHINRNPGDNRPCNLREATRAENVRNSNLFGRERKEAA